MQTASPTTTELHDVLAAIGATPDTVATLLVGITDAALHHAASGDKSCLDLVQEMVDASLRMGSVAHAVLGHVAAPKDGHTASAPVDGVALQTQLRFLREHIVSTVEQQGAGVWSVPSPAGRPLFAYAVDLMHEDRVLLADLQQVAADARAR